MSCSNFQSYHTLMYIFFNKLFHANQMTKADNRLWGSQCGTFYQFGWVYPLTSISDQKRISPYNNNTISSRQVMRLKNWWSRTKFSEKNIIRIVWKTVRRTTWWVLGSKRAKIILLGLSSNAYPVKFWMWPKGFFTLLKYYYFPLDDPQKLFVVDSEDTTEAQILSSHQSASPVISQSSSSSIPESANFSATSTDLLNAVCVVCRELPVTRAFLPCRHACICGLCSRHLRYCPMCREFIQSYFKVQDEPFIDQGDSDASSELKKLSVSEILRGVFTASWSTN